ncbi:hypothetical protein C8F01DRAFT_950579, partial [Mycena amicta]
DHFASELQSAFEKLANQARFVQMIVNRELVISNRKKVDIVVDLRKHKFHAFPKIKKAKDAGTDEPVIEEEHEQDDEDEEESVDGGSAGNNPADFDYLLGMAIASLTKEKVR